MHCLHSNNQRIQIAFHIWPLYPVVPGPSEYQVGISIALSLNATKTVQELTTTQQPLTLFQGASIQGGTFDISVNALNESPTFSLLSPRSKKARHFFIESDSD